ncbi:ABC transporter ATP-binding protein [Chryseobacterium carnipullorum]|uniref:ABC transporter ATP-binding protein n=1 Tax=Chryseobacterium carnipullorum TaxID=1124835 RepID=UPI0009216080|nr:ABC transporter ATP-binding protein [Chryseobacterium carnipullorum]MDN5395499.1 ABC transporter ATP-binding protein/permease [Chryseobacterium sp.]MDN5422090.1 ABC transporter ATP-binding protein/permease [Chryseobacterium sp.]MDN5476600.1 ABC transporter ATP-binding protein/permease [Chryseobacterium sp.]SHL67098.1 ATP-binding cassette, subfamily B, MsbA [Chryseobacterium carnipullorum]HBV16989.1 ABC transporter ATP-binding protein [Chryseobacterium carnipullorum]
MKPLQRILYFAKPHQKYLFGSMFFNILYSLLNILSVGTMLPILGLMFGTIEKQGREPIWNGELGTYFNYIKDKAYYFVQIQIDQHGAVQVLAVLCAITGVSFLLRNIFRYIGSFLLVNYRVGITKDLRTAMYNKFLQLPVSFFTEQRKGDMMSRISNDIGGVEGGIMGVLVDIINAPFMIISSLIALFLLSPQLTLFSLVVFPVMGLLISWTGKSLKKQAHYAQAELGNLFSLVDETLKSSKVIKIFNADKILKNRFNETTTNWQNFAIDMSRKRELASPMSEFLGSITILIITWYAGTQILEDQTMKPQAFLVFIGMFFQILDPAKKLSSAISSIQGGMASLERVAEVLDYDLKVEEIAEPVSISTLSNQIEFKNIGFYYDKDNVILKNFSLIIPKGKTIALVGQSGSGKTTIANLLARFYDVNEGQILIDGVDIKHLKLKEYRQLLGMVTQESVLFNDSIYNNILMGKPEATKEEVVEAAKIANADSFITNLPEGYDSNIGDDGNKLSGGQKQRVSIARAVLKNPPVMILDEATSALDTESERFVQDALDKMMENRTSLVIAHRLSTIQKADWIVVMEKGIVVEQGTHHDLIAKKGMYHKLVELQNFD